MSGRRRLPRARARACFLLIAASLLAGNGAATAAELAVGDKAPDFALPGTDGREHRLADYAGKQGLVLAWFPKASTPG